MKLKAGTVKRLHVDKRVIQSNLKHGREDPPITVQTSNGPHKTMRANLIYRGKVIASFLYSPKKPLNCGARLWVETHLEVELA